MNLQMETKLVSIHRAIIGCILLEAMHISMDKNHLHDINSRQVFHNFSGHIRVMFL